MQRAGIPRDARQAKQRRAADDGESFSFEHVSSCCACTVSFCRVSSAHCVCGRAARPIAAAGPRPPRVRAPRQAARDVGCRDGETQPDAGKPVEFAERTQDDEGAFGRETGCAQPGLEIGKEFIDHEPAALARHVLQGAGYSRPVRDAAVGIVGIDHDGVADRRRQGVEALDRDDLVPGIGPGGGMLAVGRPDDGDRRRRRDPRQPLDQGLHAGPVR